MKGLIQPKGHERIAAPGQVVRALNEYDLVSQVSLMDLYQHLVHIIANGCFVPMVPPALSLALSC